jgi:malonyl-CoA/methylmalonyl-CoA synthetase
MGEVMANHNIYFHLREAFISSASKPFLTGPDFVALSYRQCDELTGQLANLMADKGLTVGDRVLTRSVKSPMALMHYLACLRSGVIYVPVNPACTGDELDYFLADAKPSLFIGDDDHCARVSKSHGIQSLSLDENGQGTMVDAAQALPFDHDIAENQADDVAVLIYTSGTTGVPKGAMLSHDNLLANARTLYTAWDWSGDDVLLHCLPIFHVHGLFVATHLAMLGASTMLFLPRFDPDLVLDYFSDATVFMGVPTYYTRLLQDARLDTATCQHFRLFISGSAPLLAETFQAFREKTGHTILERYGMSETGMLVSNQLKGERLAGTVGYPLPGLETRIRDEAGNSVEQGDIGILQVKGANVFNGYWGKPELNRSEFQDSYFITGDMVQEAPDGRITLVGRSKDLVISGGLNIYPKEIESVLDLQPGILETAVFGIPHPDFGEGLVAAVVPEDGAVLDTDALLTACREKLAAYKSPKSIVLLNELPRNSMGKIQKNRLREQYAGLFQT